MKNDRVIVTGSEGLLGRAIVSDLVREHEVIRVSRRFGQDLTDEDFVRGWFAKNKAEYLVNCYGLDDPVTESPKKGSLFDVSLSSLDEFLRINVVSLFSVCREFARNRESRAIINLSSMYGLVSPVPSLYGDYEKHIGYSISKGAVIQLTRHLAVHLAPRIRVNCIVPGGVANKQGREFVKRYSDRAPLKRMMRRDELNGIVEYLCSEKSSYMTGAAIAVDGGWTAV